MGYAGGTTVNPSYHAIGDHSEAVQVDFDPQKITYAELVDLFWTWHDPTFQPFSRQYENILFYQGAEQAQIALASFEKQKAQWGNRLVTRVEALKTFYPAEGYHQKYFLQSDPILGPYSQGLYPEIKAFMDSSAAMRVNAYLGGRGSERQLEAEIDQILPSPAAQERLRTILANRD